MPSSSPSDRSSLDAFVAMAGIDLWRDRIAEIERQARGGPRSGKAVLQHHGLSYAIERLRRGLGGVGPTERRAGELAREAVTVAGSLEGTSRDRFVELLGKALTGENTLAPLFHLLRTAALQRSRGFTVRFTGLQDRTPFDLLIVRGGTEVEVVCEVVSANDGRFLNRAAWFRLADRIDPDLHTWLADHPGRYLLRVSLPDGLQEGEQLARLHDRIRHLLASTRRADHDPAVVLRLDPLLLAGAQADELGLLSSLKREFGPDAHLSVTAAGGGVFAMAAHSGRENEVARAICRRLSAIAPARLTGTRPGILAMFVEDTDRLEWRGLRDRLELEGNARQFLTRPEAKPVVAVTFASRLEMLGAEDAASDGDLRFRNPAHPAARVAALSPAVASSV
jgi:hypothetical protein